MDMYTRYDEDRDEYDLIVDGEWYAQGSYEYISECMSELASSYYYSDDYYPEEDY